jgi:hypothetical protein
MNISIRPKPFVGRIGWFTRVLYAVAVVLRRFCPFFSIEKYYLVAQPATEQKLLPEKWGKGISVERIDRYHPLISQLPRPRDEIARRFAGGALCFLATRQDRIIGHLWITQSAYREPYHRCEYRLQPPGRTAWDFDMWISPDDRIGFAFARLWDQCNSYLREQGVTWTCSRVSAFKPESLTAHQRLGMRVMHTLFYMGAGPVELLIADVAPFIALSFSPRKFPVIELIPPEGN